MMSKPDREDRIMVGLMLHMWAHFNCPARPSSWRCTCPSAPRSRLCATARTLLEHAPFCAARRGQREPEFLKVVPGLVVRDQTDAGGETVASSGRGGVGAVHEHEERVRAGAGRRARSACTPSFGTSGECLSFVKVPDSNFLGKVTTLYCVALLCHRDNDECVKRAVLTMGAVRRTAGGEERQAVHPGHTTCIYFSTVTSRAC